MLSYDDVAYSVAGRPLLVGVSFVVHVGDRVGLVGPNGAGKSTLLALAAARVAPDRGDVGRPRGWRIAEVEQHDAHGTQSCVDFVLDGDDVLRAAEAALARAQEAGDGEAEALAHGELAELDAYSARANVAAMLAGLGFPNHAIDRPVDSFSGGWRMRLALARALVRRSDLLLLDEPTNHLDLEAVVWLQGWLARYPGTLMVVAHDREFLDAVVQRVVHVTRHGVRAWRGNYSAFERARAEALAVESAAYARQQREIAHIQSFITRFRAKATKARQAQSRVKALEKLELIAPAHVDSGFSFTIDAPERSPRPLLRTEGVDIGYDGKAVVRGVGVQVDPGMRIGILGVNGAGKSTLVRLLAGTQPPMAGQLHVADGLKVGYFAQSQLEQLDADASPMLHLARLDPTAREQDLRNFLGGYGFSGERADEPAGVRSGGERARLTLALLAYSKPHLLLLDEPTNHLDLDMRHALTVALQAYAGAVVLVSHDRHLLRVIPDVLWWVHDGRMSVFDGDLDDYVARLRERRADGQRTQAAGGESGAGSDASRTDRRRAAAASREQLKPLRRAAQAAERAVEQLSGKVAGVDAELEDPALYGGGEQARLEALSKSRAALAAQLEAAEAAWLEAEEALESARGAE